MKKLLALAAFVLALASCGHKDSPKIVPPVDGGRSTVKGVAFRLIPAGKFTHKEAQHIVTRPFRLSETEITNAQYCEFLLEEGVGEDGRRDDRLLIVPDEWGCVWNADNTCWQPAKERGDCPVVCVTWYGAQAYCEWLGGTLPTEQQWELAAQGNRCSERSGWYAFNSKFTTQPVGRKDVGSYGLYDMLGNVWEWCADLHDTAYDAHTHTDYDASALRGATKRIYRGGSWILQRRDCNTYARRSAPAEYHINDLGFRVCLP